MAARHEASRGSVIDFLLLAILLALALGALVRWAERDGGDGGDTFATVVLRTDALPVEVASCLAVGDVLRLEDGTELGVSEDWHTAPTRVVLERDGIFYEGEDTRSVMLTAVVRVRGSFDGKSFWRAGRSALPIGLPVTLYTDRVVLHAVVAELLPVGNG